MKHAIWIHKMDTLPFRARGKTAGWITRWPTMGSKLRFAIIVGVCFIAGLLAMIFFGERF